MPVKAINFMLSVGDYQCKSSLSRRDAVLINRLRTGHTRLTLMYCQGMISQYQWRNLSAAAPANAGAPKGPTKMVYQICERLVNIECKTLKRVVDSPVFDAHKISLHSFINTWDVLMYNTVRNVKFSFASISD